MFQMRYYVWDRMLQAMKVRDAVLLSCIALAMLAAQTAAQSQVSEPLPSTTVNSHV